MATKTKKVHDLKPKDVTRSLDLKFLLRRKKKDDKHKEGAKESVSETE